MATRSNICRQSIQGLGQRLHQHRLRRGQNRTQFSKKLGISTAALRSMETGRPGVSIGQWAEVLRRLKRLDDFDKLLSDTGHQSAFEHQSHQRRLRQRVSQLRL